ncbi:MAG: hypothetical protein MUE53_04575 [Chitinophagales bacterium]|jgi:hypothetical protein|nr:hypothetical protein [Chitinophagales bacterium]
MVKNLVYFNLPIAIISGVWMTQLSSRPVLGLFFSISTWLYYTSIRFFYIRDYEATLKDEILDLYARNLTELLFLIGFVILGLLLMLNKYHFQTFFSIKLLIPLSFGLSYPLARPILGFKNIWISAAWLSLAWSLGLDIDLIDYIYWFAWILLLSLVYDQIDEGKIAQYYLHLFSLAFLLFSIYYDNYAVVFSLVSLNILLKFQDKISQKYLWTSLVDSAILFPIFWSGVLTRT